MHPRRCHRHGNCPRERGRRVGLPASRREPSHPGERRDLPACGRLAGHPPGRLVGNDSADEVGAAEREVDRARRSNARAHHDRRCSPQPIQKRSGIFRMCPRRRDRIAAGPAISPPVVGDHPKRSAATRQLRSSRRSRGRSFAPTARGAPSHLFALRTRSFGSSRTRSWLRSRGLVMPQRSTHRAFVRGIADATQSP
jgi:hypothetical protein